MLIDHQAHWFPRSGFELILDRPGAPTTARVGDGYRFTLSPRFTTELTAECVELDLQLEDMDAHGVATMLGSPALVLGDVAAYEIELAVEMCELLNAEMAGAQREHPDRFVGVATLPWQDPQRALTVLDRAATEHALRAVSLHANIAGGPVATEELLPVYQRIDALGLPLVLHPTADTAMAGAYARYGGSVEMISWLFDTSAAALALIYGGVLDACPGLTVLHPHLGGALPFVFARIQAFHRVPGRETQQPIEHYFRERFFVDSVTTTPGAYAMAQCMYGDERIVFATDYPFVPRRASLGFLAGELDDETRAALYDRTLPIATSRQPLT